MVQPSKREDDSGLSSYYNNKTTIIQEARVFNDSPISPRKCRTLLTRIVYLLYVGETFGTQEATTLFFGTTKLFQHKDVSCHSWLIYEVADGLSLCYRVHWDRPSIWRSRSLPPLQKMWSWLPAVSWKICNLIQKSFIDPMQFELYVKLLTCVLKISMFFFGFIADYIYIAVYGPRCWTILQSCYRRP